MIEKTGEMVETGECKQDEPRFIPFYAEEQVIECPIPPWMLTADAKDKLYGEGMGTNYYCETGRMLKVKCDCGFIHEMPETLHIGRNSWGWKFSLHKIPEKGLNCFKDWAEVLDASTKIYDEYDDSILITPDEMKAIILKKNTRNDLTEDDKKFMIARASEKGYELDDKCWLFSMDSDLDGTDGNYSMVLGEFS